MTQSNIVVGSDALDISLNDFKSAHRLPGQFDWWTPAGTNGDYIDQWPRLTAEQLGDWDNTRACLYYDTGLTDYRVEGTWEGNHGFTCFPMVCINPDASEFGYTAYLEPDIASLLILWELGRDALPSPGEIVAVGSVANPGGAHVDGTPVDVRMDVIGTTLTVYFDGVLTFTQAITANLQDSGIVGISMDKLDTTAPPNDINEGMLISSFKVTPL
tara:strand:- start:1131 stop:1775 length:645 start_codon:yes stop_codon:yes gene_type:complete